MRNQASSLSDPWIDTGEAFDPVDEKHRWSWAELFVAIQLVLGLVLFLPGAQTYRTLIRALPYVASGAALVYYFRRGTGEPLPASSKWLSAMLALLVLNLLHETTHWVAGIAQVVFQLCIAAPAFWMGRAVRSEAHLMRVLWVLFVASALSSALGVLQVYYPATFLPREFSALARSTPGYFCHDLVQRLRGGDEQRLALARTLLGQLRVVAGHQAFARELRRVISASCARSNCGPGGSAFGQPADIAAAQRRDPAQARMFLERLDLRLREHAAIADQHDRERPNRSRSVSTWSGTVWDRRCCRGRPARRWAARRGRSTRRRR